MTTSSETLRPSIKRLEMPCSSKIAGHLLAPAVNGDELRPACDLGELTGNRVSGFRVIEKRPADFDQHPHSKASVSGNPSMRFMFWTACPAAPLTKLSSAATIVTALGFDFKYKPDITEIGVLDGA